MCCYDRKAEPISFSQTWMRVCASVWNQWTGPEPFSRPESTARRFSLTRCAREGFDLVLVAAAVTLGATWFLSFDRNSRQRPLATAAGLRVWPALDKDEKGQVKHAMQHGER